MEEKEKSTQNDSENSAAIKLLNRYRRAKTYEEEERKIWLRCYQYVNNWVDNELGQWRKETKDKMGEKPMLSIPLVRKFINRIAGAQSSAKIDEKAFPRDDMGDAIIAEILTDLKSYAYELNNADYQKARAFRDMLITGRGFIKACWNDENDPLGEITIKRINPFRVFLIGDAEEYDTSKMDEVIDVSYISYDRLVAMYPDKKEELEGLKNEMDDKGYIGSPVGGYDYSPKGEQFDEEVRNNEGKYTIIRSQRYEYVPVTLINMPDKGYQEIDPKTVREVQKAVGVKLPVIKKKVRRVRELTICGNVVLDEQVGRYKHGKFDIIGWFAYNDNGRITGIAQDLIDIQDEKNKRRSQIIHMLGTAAKNSYWVKKGALDDVESAKRDVGRVGALIEVNGEPSQVAKPIDSNMTALPAIVGMEEKAEMDFNSVSGLTDASLGQVPDGVKSGRGINQLQQGVEVIISELFEHHLMSSKLLAQLTIALIQQYYDEPRRVRILGDYSAKFIPPELKQMMDMGIVEAVQEGAKIISINTSPLNDVTVGRYDIVIDATSSNPTTRRAQFFDLLNMKAQGAPIAWSKVLSLSDVRGAQELAQMAAEAEQAMAMQQMIPPQATSAPRTANPPKTPIEQDQAFNTAGAQM